MHRDLPGYPDEAALEADPVATKRRLAKLQAYMDTNVLGPAGFCCNSYEACRESIRPGDEFSEGQLSHLGAHYDLYLDAKPLRIMVVGQEYGGRKPEVSLKERYTQVHDTSGLTKRYYADREHEPRNPHMRGTTQALRLILGTGIGADSDGEFVQTHQGERFHVFDAFALVNALLCSAHPPRGSTGRSTKTMRRNCLRHFAATVEVLEPTLMVLQGEGVQNWIAPVLGLMQDRPENLAEARIGGKRVLVCRFSHPSARGVLRWGDRLDAPYLTDVVAPTLREAVAAL